MKSISHINLSLGIEMASLPDGSAKVPAELSHPSKLKVR